jgi:hypothetical protein
VSAASSSVQAEVLPVMPNEDKADIPGAWRDVVHPRRHGMIAVEPAHDSGEGAGLTTMESQRVFTRALRVPWAREDDEVRRGWVVSSRLTVVAEAQRLRSSAE